MPFDSWSHKVTITSVATQIDSAYPYALLFDCNANLAGVSDFWNNVKSDGSDIRVSKADGSTEVARGVRGFNVGSEAGLIYLIHPDISTSSDVDMVLYFGNAGASDYADTDALGYQGIWEGESINVHYPCDTEDISGTTLLDQSGNGLNGTLVNQAAGGSGKVGGGITFDGTGDTITRANASNVVIPASNAAWTLQLWYNCGGVSGATTTRSIMSNETAGTSGVRVGIDGGSWGVTGGFRFDSSESGGTIGANGAALALTTWHMMTCSYTGSAANVHANATEDYAIDATGTIVSNTNTITIGGGIGGHRQWLGQLDDIRIFPRALSYAEHATIYNNHNANASFWNVGSVQPNTAARKFILTRPA